jgi:hypothetical protein
MRLLILVVAIISSTAASAVAQVGPTRHWLEFRGQFDSVPVRVSGRNANELYRECMDLVASSGLEQARELWIEGRRIVRRDGSFAIDAACAMGVLNAVPAASDRGAPTLTGALDGIPFAIHAANEDAREIVRLYVPIMAAGMRVTRLAVAGEIFLSPEGWTADDIVSWLDRALGGDGRRVRYTVLR